MKRLAPLFITGLIVGSVALSQEKPSVSEPAPLLLVQEIPSPNVFLRYLGEVAHAVATIKDYGDRPRKDLYGRLVDVAKCKTAVADTQLKDEGKQREDAAEEFGENVLIVNPEETPGETASSEPTS